MGSGRERGDTQSQLKYILDLTKNILTQEHKKKFKDKKNQT